MNPVSILILEDNVEFAQALIASFNKYCAKVNWQTFVERAKKACLSEHFDIVVSDLHLSIENANDSGSGVAFIKYLRQKIKSDAVLAVTTGLTLVSSHAILRLGVDFFYYKPLEIGFDQFAEKLMEAHGKRVRDST